MKQKVANGILLLDRSMKEFIEKFIRETLSMEYSLEPNSIVLNEDHKLINELDDEFYPLKGCTAEEIAT